MPVISRIDAAPYNIPLKGALTWGSGHELRQLAHVLIRVELSDGAVGFAEAIPRPSIYGETQASILHIIDEQLAPMLLGETIDSFADVAALAARAAIIKNNNTARGALDMALHQALASSRGERLASLSGRDPAADSAERHRQHRRARGGRGGCGARSIKPAFASSRSRSGVTFPAKSRPSPS